MSSSFLPQPTSIANYWNALEVACAQGALELTDALLRRWKSESSDGLSASQFSNLVCLAAQKGHAAIVSLLFDQRAQMKDAQMQDWVPGCAVRSDETNFDALQALLDHGWDINEPNDHGDPAIKFVAVNPDRLRWFLQKGADPNLAFSRGATALSVAAASSDLDTSLQCLQLLLHSGAHLSKNDALHNGAALARIPVMELMLSHGADIEAIQYADVPDSARLARVFRVGRPLHTAVKRHKLASVEFLLQQGADPQSKDTQDYTPLQWAQAKKFDDIASILEAAIRRLG